MPHGVPRIPGAPQTQISWYNERVPDVFKFAYEPDTLCFVAISTPSTFEKAFLPFVLDNRNSSVKDPYDQCMTACFSRVKEVSELVGRRVLLRRSGDDTGVVACGAGPAALLRFVYFPTGAWPSGPLTSLTSTARRRHIRCTLCNGSGSNGAAPNNFDDLPVELLNCKREHMRF
ncbi:hypothetical protein HPB48_026928 [Haemaphysalis longicornis]|uniref:Cyanocobalamin reductase (cyanide-eliminating) n=1 Tax=Haemaphysalis longicornis TaxID=44386 RepID=A0A9J6HCQ0_HAELO|nr:hypothetical protein HPB48_026928 [Haemaphysalis longicornis]